MLNRKRMRIDFVAYFSAEDRSHEFHESTRIESSTFVLIRAIRGQHQLTSRLLL